METYKQIYCRLCAEPKSTSEVYNLSEDNKKCEEIVMKLSFLNAMYVEVDTEKTVCLVCYDSLNNAYEFLHKVKKSQSMLLVLFSNKSSNQSRDEESDDDRKFDDFINSDGIDNPIDSSVLKIELESTQDGDDKYNNFDMILKTEPKEELDSGVNEESVASGDLEDTLNVQDILDAAMCKIPYSAEDIDIYAKEISRVSKKSSSTEWKSYSWLCSVCNIGFLDMDTLRSHSKVTHGRCNAFMCFDCKDYTKNDFNSFIKHVRKHRKKLRKRCCYCDAKITEDKMMSHVREHFKKTEVPCHLCGEILQDEETLQQHLAEFNTTKAQRKPRRKKGTPITEADLTCDVCKKVYKTTNSLRDHMKRHSKDHKKNFTCERCGKTFFNKGALTSHIMNHDQVRPHSCRICNKAFLFPNMLRRHVDMHSGVKPYSCEQCGRCFRLQYQLKAHKIIHTDAMPHVCQYCNKAFRFKQILRNHERQHTGIKPYACQTCGMEFVNWSNYNKHMKRRHGTDTAKKKITPDGVFPINPQTGQMFQHDVDGTEEWKTKIMVPTKRGKKRVLKQNEDS